MLTNYNIPYLHVNKANLKPKGPNILIANTIILWQHRPNISNDKFFTSSQWIATRLITPRERYAEAIAIAMGAAPGSSQLRCISCKARCISIIISAHAHQLGIINKKKSG